MSRMFRIVTETWNPVTGCEHGCRYCWARSLCIKRLSKMHPHYAKHGFRPALNEGAFKRKFKPMTLVFVCSMGDLFGDWVPREWIERVVRYTWAFPRTDFLFCSKNPIRYPEFLDLFEPGHHILGTTTETNRDVIVKEWSNAPLPSERYKAMVELDFPRKFLSIEPIMDFDLLALFEWIKDINPEYCEIGYDNYHNRLPEPSIRKTRRLISLKRRVGIDTREKTIRKAWWEEEE